MFKEKNILQFANSGYSKTRLKKFSTGFFKALASGFISSARSLPVVSPFSTRYFTVSCPYLTRISPVQSKNSFGVRICAFQGVRAKFYSNRSVWGEVPRFTGKSPPVRLCYSERHDVFRDKFNTISKN